MRHARHYTSVVVRLTESRTRIKCSTSITLGASAFAASASCFLEGRAIVLLGCFDGSEDEEREKGIVDDA